MIFYQLLSINIVDYYLSIAILICKIKNICFIINYLNLIERNKISIFKA